MGFLSNKIWVRIFLGHPVCMYAPFKKLFASFSRETGIFDVGRTANLLILLPNDKLLQLWLYYCSTNALWQGVCSRSVFCFIVTGNNFTNRQTLTGRSHEDANNQWKCLFSLIGLRGSAASRCAAPWSRRAKYNRAFRKLSRLCDVVPLFAVDPMLVDRLQKLASPSRSRSPRRKRWVPEHGHFSFSNCVWFGVLGIL